VPAAADRALVRAAEAVWGVALAGLEVLEAAEVRAGVVLARAAGAGWAPAVEWVLAVEWALAVGLALAAVGPELAVARGLAVEGREPVQVERVERVLAAETRRLGSG
jgi:hypothetical protein